MSENNYSEKISKIIDEFSKKFSDDGNNEFMIEFAERNLKEFINNADDIIRNLNCFTNDKSLKVAVYVYIFGLLFSSLNSDNSTVINHINITLSIIGELFSEANKNLKAQKEISDGYKYALDKLQNTQWHKYPEDKPKENGRYLVTQIITYTEGYKKSVNTHSYYAGKFNDIDWMRTIAWAELPEPYEG